MSTDRRELSRCMKLNKTLTLDMINYMLRNDCRVFSGEAINYACNVLKRKATSHEVIGVLRNKPVFKKTDKYDKDSGALWVLDIWALPEFLQRMEMEERFLENDEGAQMVNIFTNEVIMLLKKSLEEYNPNEMEPSGVIKKMKEFWNLIHLVHPEALNEEQQH